MNDADIETAMMIEAANNSANGVCPICEDMLDPTNPKWAAEFPGGTYRGRGKITPEGYAAAIGPVAAVGGYHKWCLDNPDIPW